jgi:16S rRNA (uracil1498-N3)-methyltransferase
VNIILLEPTEVSGDGQVRVTGARASHLTRVLAVQPGHDVRVGIVDGATGRGVVTAVDEAGVALQCSFGAAPSDPLIDVLLALPRPKVMRRLWAQLAALGVGRIMLTNAERVERHYFDTHVIGPEAFRPLLIEGLQQARDTRMPDVSVHRRFRPLVEDELDRLCPSTLRLVADPGVTTSPSDAVRATPGRRVLLAIGPEGGWNQFELDLLRRRGFSPVSLGPRTLRSDTACVALLAVVRDAQRHSVVRD